MITGKMILTAHLTLTTPWSLNSQLISTPQWQLEMDAKKCVSYSQTNSVPIAALKFSTETVMARTSNHIAPFIKYLSLKYHTKTQQTQTAYSRFTLQI